MSEVEKLRKRAHKAHAAKEEALIAVSNAVEAYGAAERALGAALDQLEQAEALEAARELRAGGKSK